MISNIKNVPLIVTKYLHGCSNPNSDVVTTKTEKAEEVTFLKEWHMVVLYASMIPHPLVHEAGKVVIFYATMLIRIQQTGRPKSMLYRQATNSINLHYKSTRRCYGLWNASNLVILRYRDIQIQFLKFLAFV